MKRRIFLVCLFTVFLDYRSTNLLRLFSGNLPAMFSHFLTNNSKGEPFLLIAVQNKLNRANKRGYRVGVEIISKNLRFWYFSAILDIFPEYTTSLLKNVMA